jgi:hypothetical protein
MILIIAMRELGAVWRGARRMEREMLRRSRSRRDRP